MRLFEALLKSPVMKARRANSKGKETYAKAWMSISDVRVIGSYADSVVRKLTRSEIEADDWSPVP